MTRRRRALLIDDEEALLRLLSTVLTRHGYEVTCCSRASEVRELSSEQRFEAAVMDLGLPDVSGTELVHYLLHRHPGLPILVTSGSPFDPETLGVDNAVRVRFLPKPYLPKSLIENLEGLLQS